VNIVIHVNNESDEVQAKLLANQIEEQFGSQYIFGVYVIKDGKG
jgi:hypothetical protein